MDSLFWNELIIKILVQDCLHAMKVMNAKVAFLPLGGIKAGWEKIPALRTEVVKRLKEVGDMAASEGVVIGIETQLDAKGDVKLLKEINSPGIKIYLNFKMHWRMEGICARS